MHLVIFDCDGTLVDSQHMIVASMEDAFALAGLARPRDADVRRVIGLSLVEAVARLLVREERHRAGEIAEAYKTAFRGLREKGEMEEPLYPGVRETILALSARQDVLLAVATGKSRRGVDAVLDREGLADRFVSIQTADDHPSKPDPSMILKAMAETGAEAARTLMIGDTTYDMEMAANAGVMPIGVAWGYHATDDLRRAGADMVIEESTGLGAATAALISAAARQERS
jgi:phosphoglycolate phosphatase